MGTISWHRINETLIAGCVLLAIKEIFDGRWHYAAILLASAGVFALLPLLIRPASPRPMIVVIILNTRVVFIVLSILILVMVILVGAAGVSVHLIDVEMFPQKNGIYLVPQRVEVELRASGLRAAQSAWIIVQDIPAVRYYVQNVGPLNLAGTTRGSVYIGDGRTPSGHRFRIVGVIVDGHARALFEQNRSMAQLPPGVTVHGFYCEDGHVEVARR